MSTEFYHNVLSLCFLLNIFCMAMYVIPGCLLALLYVKIFIIFIFVYANSFKIDSETSYPNLN